MTQTQVIPVRIQRKRAKGWKMPENTLYVGRPTKWGNPFKVNDRPKYFSVKEKHLTVTNLFYFACHDPSGSPCPEHFERIVNDIEQLKGKNLACFCPLDQPCHADVLLKLANH